MRARSIAAAVPATAIPCSRTMARPARSSIKSSEPGWASARSMQALSPSLRSAAMTESMGFGHQRHRPEQTLFYQIVERHYWPLSNTWPRPANSCPLAFVRRSKGICNAVVWSTGFCGCTRDGSTPGLLAIRANRLIYPACAATFARLSTWSHSDARERGSGVSAQLRQLQRQAHDRWRSLAGRSGAARAADPLVRFACRPRVGVELSVFAAIPTGHASGIVRPGVRVACL